MKKAFCLVLLLISVASAQTKKHAPTEAHKCWITVQSAAVLDLAVASQDEQSTALVSGEMNRCATVLALAKEPAKAAIASKLIALLLFYREAPSNAQLKTTITQQTSALADLQKAKEGSEKSVAFMVNLYNSLDEEHKTTVSQCSQFVAQVAAYQPPAQPQRQGFWSSVASGMAQAAQADAARPTVHCVSSRAGDTVYTDCR